MIQHPPTQTEGVDQVYMYVSYTLYKGTYWQ